MQKKVFPSSEKEILKIAALRNKLLKNISPYWFILGVFTLVFDLFLFKNFQFLIEIYYQKTESYSNLLG